MGPGPSNSAGALAYNTFYFGEMTDGLRSLLMEPGITGFVNENFFLGGRWSEQSGMAWESGAVHIDIRDSGLNQPNGNKFYAPIFEGKKQILRDEGQHTVIENARMETFQGIPGTDMTDKHYEFLAGSATFPKIEITSGPDLLGSNATRTSLATGFARVNDWTFDLQGVDERDWYWPGAPLTCSPWTS